MQMLILKRCSKNGMARVPAALRRPCHRLSTPAHRLEQESQGEIFLRTNLSQDRDHGNVGLPRASGSTDQQVLVAGKGSLEYPALNAIESPAEPAANRD